MPLVRETGTSVVLSNYYNGSGLCIHLRRPSMRKLVYYVAVTIDGFIAAPDGDAGFFANAPETVAALFGRYPETCPAHLREMFGIGGDPVRFDAVILGARTHQPALDAGLTSAYPHLRQFVVTNRDLPHDPTV